MGLAIQLQNEHGVALAPAVEDRTNSFAKLLPSEDDNSFHLIRYVDRYGNTLFNGIQMNDLRLDLALLERRATNAADRQIIAAIKELTQRCEEEPHRYLKFIGD